MSCNNDRLGRAFRARGNADWDNRLAEAHLGAAVAGDCFRKHTTSPGNQASFLLLLFFFLTFFKIRMAAVVEILALFQNAETGLMALGVPLALEFKKENTKDRCVERCSAEKCLDIRLKLRGKQ